MTKTKEKWRARVHRLNDRIGGLLAQSVNKVQEGRELEGKIMSFVAGRIAALEEVLGEITSIFGSMRTISRLTHPTPDGVTADLTDGELDAIAEAKVAHALKDGGILAQDGMLAYLRAVRAVLARESEIAVACELKRCGVASNVSSREDYDRGRILCCIREVPSVLRLQLGNEDGQLATSLSWGETLRRLSALPDDAGYEAVEDALLDDVKEDIKEDVLLEEGVDSDWDA